MFVVMALACSSALLGQQTFDSGSNGSDGALNLTTPGTILFDPSTFSPPLDPDGDGVYHFTTINIATDVTVNLSASKLGQRPVLWLAQGNVTISGALALNGDPGHVFGSPAAAVPGAGGFAGGYGSTPTTVATGGQGPGGGNPSPTSAGSAGGSGAGYLSQGGAGDNGAQGGTSYGNFFLQPLVGGSGGAGGGPAVSTTQQGGGGGAGGGALLLASSTTIVVTGSLQANGGIGRLGLGGNFSSGGGSGGALRLIATSIQGGGSILVNGGSSGGSGAGNGSRGRVRLEAINQQFAGTIDPNAYFSTPGSVFPPAGGPSVRVSAVDGVAVPSSPTGGFPPADVVINEAGPVTFSIEASNIPLGTVVRLTMFAESRETLTIDSTPLAGTLESSTATATATLPSGFSRFTVQATWTP